MNKPPTRQLGAGMAVLVLGAVLTWVEPGGSFWQGWLAYTVLLGLSLVVTLAVARLTAAPPGIWTAALSAFIVRVAVGVLLTLLLPAAGYSHEVTNQGGYVFTDAYVRDTSAWDLASSPDALLEAFSGKYPGDQYGGMLFLSAAIYRLLSPDLHRQVLILIPTAALGAVGVLFLWKALSKWLGGQVAALAAWIFAIYPEAVLLGASQMRESFVFTAIAAGFYGVTQIGHSWRAGLSWLALAGLVLMPMQPAVGLAAFIVLAGLWLLDPERRGSWRPLVAFAILTAAAAAIVYSVWANLPSLQGGSPAEVFVNWLVNNFNLQVKSTVRPSGIVQAYLKTWISLLAYGVARPVLPGALVEPAPLIWQTINTFRAAGWYLLAPVLLYGGLKVFRAGERRSQLIWIALCVWAWVLVASANGGADAWDNPRYRTLFLAWMATLAAWTWVRTRQLRDPWLNRLLLVEAVFVLLFTEWYISRYYPGSLVHLSFPVMVIISLAAGGLILIGGWLLDRARIRQAGIHVTREVER